MRKSVVGALAGMTALASVGVAVASEQFEQTYQLTYSATKTKSSSGFSTLITSSDPGDPQAKPKAVRKVVINFAEGTKFDTSVPGVCSATDQDLSSQGAAACPASSKIGSGTAEANAQPVIPVANEQITVFNAKNGIIFYLSGLQTLVIRGKISGRKLTATVPALPLPVAGQEAVLTKFQVEVKGKKKGKKFYARTPASCKNGKWTTTAKFSYADGTTETVKSTSKCKKKKK